MNCFFLLIEAIYGHVFGNVSILRVFHLKSSISLFHHKDTKTNRLSLMLYHKQLMAHKNASYLDKALSNFNVLWNSFHKKMHSFILTAVVSVFVSEIFGMHSFDSVIVRLCVCVYAQASVLHVLCRQYFIECCMQNERQRTVFRFCRISMKWWREEGIQEKKTHTHTHRFRSIYWNGKRHGQWKQTVTSSWSCC